MARIDRYVALIPTGPLRNHLVAARGHALAHLESGRSLLDPIRQTTSVGE